MRSPVIKYLLNIDSIQEFLRLEFMKSDSVVDDFKSNFFHTVILFQKDLNFQCNLHEFLRK